MSEAGVGVGLHEVVWVRGPDTIGFLDGLVSQDVAGMATGAAASSLLLAPNGKLRAPHVLWRGVDEVGLVAGPGAGEIVAGDLRRFKIRVDVVIEAETDPVLTLVGDEAAGVLNRLGIDVAGGWSRSADCVVGAVPYPRSETSRFVVIGRSVEELVDAGAKAWSPARFETLRISEGEPLVGVDVDDGTIPQEMGAVDAAVSFTKGCYLGQELVARIDSRGHVNRHLRSLVFDAATPTVGSDIRVGDDVVGRLSSVAAVEGGGAVGLAMIRREVSAGDSVIVGSDAAIVAEPPLG